jgi:nucleoid-associated protein EbfC
MFKNLTNLAGAMRNLSQMGTQLKALNLKLEAARVYGSADSGTMSVKVEMTGHGIVLALSVSDDLLATEHKALLEQLTKDAMNQAIKASKEMHISAFKELTGGVELFPGLNQILENMVK